MVLRIADNGGGAGKTQPINPIFRQPNVAPPPSIAAPKPPAPRPVPANPPAPTPVFGGGGGGGGTSVGPYAAAPMAAMDAGAAAPAPQPISEEDYLAGDSSYQAQLAALVRALSDYQAGDTAKRAQYNTDYSNTLKNLGYNEGTKAWATNDTNTAAGRSYQNQLNDFAGRGLLQSSLYGSAVDNLMRSLNDQYSGIAGAKTNFLSDQDRALSQYKNQNTLDSQQARAEALARRAAGLSLT